MIEFLNSPVTLGTLIGIFVSLFIFQIVVLLRIKFLLQQISFYIESISRFFYRAGLSPSVKRTVAKTARTCQTCKHRLSFIHMSENEGEVEDFYYKCQLRNTEVQLSQTCEKYKIDENY